MYNHLSINAAFAHLAYGVKTTDKQKDLFAFDTYDLWFGDDFNWLIDNWLEETLAEIETDISSVDSSNLSEAHSEQISAQSSADRAAQIAAGITPSEVTSAGSFDPGSCGMPTCPSVGESGSRVSTLNTPGNTSSTSTNSDAEEETTQSHDHSAHHGAYHGTTESTFSGVSWSDDEDYTGLSNSEGTSQDTGEASTVSSVSFTII